MINASLSYCHIAKFFFYTTRLLGLYVAKAQEIMVSETREGHMGTELLQKRDPQIYDGQNSES